MTSHSVFTRDSRSKTQKIATLFLELLCWHVARCPCRCYGMATHYTLRKIPSLNNVILFHSNPNPTVILMPSSSTLPQWIRKHFVCTASWNKPKTCIVKSHFLWMDLYWVKEVKFTMENQMSDQTFSAPVQLGGCHDTHKNCQIDH